MARVVESGPSRPFGDAAVGSAVCEILREPPRIFAFRPLVRKGGRVAAAMWLIPVARKPPLAGGQKCTPFGPEAAPPADSRKKTILCILHAPDWKQGRRLPRAKRRKSG